MVTVKESYRCRNWLQKREEKKTLENVIDAVVLIHVIFSQRWHHIYSHTNLIQKRFALLNLIWIGWISFYLNKFKKSKRWCTVFCEEKSKQRINLQTNKVIIKHNTHQLTIVADLEPNLLFWKTTTLILLGYKSIQSILTGTFRVPRLKYYRHLFT